jgi:hypothetical protein
MQTSVADPLHLRLVAQPASVALTTTKDRGKQIRKHFRSFRYVYDTAMRINTYRDLSQSTFSVPVLGSTNKRTAEYNGSLAVLPVRNDRSFH